MDRGKNIESSSNLEYETVIGLETHVELSIYKNLL